MESERVKRVRQDQEEARLLMMLVLTVMAFIYTELVQPFPWHIYWYVSDPIFLTGIVAPCFGWRQRAMRPPLPSFDPDILPESK